MSDRSCREEGSVPVKMVFGILVVVLGVIFLGDNLGWIEAREAFRIFWPAAFVAIGLTVLTQSRSGHMNRAWGLVWILAGIYVLIVVGTELRRPRRSRAGMAGRRA